MPYFYSEENSVLGTRPRRVAVVPAARPATGVLVLLVLLALLLGGALLAWPAGDVARRAEAAVAQIAVVGASGKQYLRSGWVYDPQGFILMTRDAAFPEGLERPPQSRTLTIGGDGNLVDLPARLVDYGRPEPGHGNDTVQLRRNWALLQIALERATLTALPADTNPEAVQPGRPLWVCGASSGSNSTGTQSKLARLYARVVTVRREPGLGAVRADHGVATPAEMLGGPVLDAWSGRVIGLSAEPPGEAPRPGAGGQAEQASSVLPVHLLDNVLKQQRGGVAAQ
ncbi:MAG: trypsin-like peptidase domain-containing protein [Fimbriimonadaceae bacterium]|nr:trypsin-like peptidase domain-containing protein [Fimbriimonadaceae bacterium]